ncbi:MAG: excinuclease ABC subunit A [Planctomycetota bacterium]|nr:MAG: excinuclease ABC subunit A [Planctomycetota bacterium]
MKSSSSHAILIRGAREHNLHNLSLTLPHQQLIVVSGISGCGKSSLVYNTIYQESRRRFLESLSPYARQFLGKMHRPQVDLLEGLQPAICIDQKSAGRSPRSTVGTITGIYDLLRLLFARLGSAFCPICQRPIEHQSVDQIVDKVLQTFDGQTVFVLAPLVQHRKGEYRKLFEELAADGYKYVRINRTLYELPLSIELGRYEAHTIEVVVDRIRVEKRKRARLSEAIERALAKTNGLVNLLELSSSRPKLYSSQFACPEHGSPFSELEPHLFSFNSPQGACPQCRGLGLEEKIPPHLLVPNPRLSLAQGAIAPLGHRKRLPFTKYCQRDLKKIAQHFRIPWNKPWEELSDQQQKWILYGSPDYNPKEWIWRRNPHFLRTNRIPGIIPLLEHLYQIGGWHLKKYILPQTCTACGGNRLRPEALTVRFRRKNIAQLASLTAGKLRTFLKRVRLQEEEILIGERLLQLLIKKTNLLCQLGLDYLTIDRRANTLSGGEAQRLRLASQLGSPLQNILYVLDEPTIGLHPYDSQRLIQTLVQLKSQGNTLLVVEHDPAVILSADCVVELGPRAAKDGGKLVAMGPPKEVISHPTSLTARCIQQIPQRARAALERPRRPLEQVLQIRQAYLHNLKNIDVQFPLNHFIVITGISGSGKSSLYHVLVDALQRQKEDFPPQYCQAVQGHQYVHNVIQIDQKPIGRTPRSNPATYTKALDGIRKLLSSLPLSQMRNYKPGRFSFNVHGGRCPTCQGGGVIVMEMQFLADVEIPCPECNGERFLPDTLEVRYKGKNIFDILQLTVDEALECFSHHKTITRPLQTLQQIGLGYLTLGQPSTTLSGGEAQRLKLARELCKSSQRPALYLLDEPTTGLHSWDVEKLLNALRSLVDRGHTVVVIEHNLDVVAEADYIIDLGPKGGDKGGEVVFQGTPDELIQVKKSFTARALKKLLSKRAKLSPPSPSPPALPSSQSGISLRGVRTHNLKNLDLTLPTGAITVITGPSGCGKTSLAMDTLFAEGQRRYLESLSSYARRFLSILNPPPVEEIHGICPAIAIERKPLPPNPRSNVATITEIYDHLRLLYARIAQANCLYCHRPLTSFSPSQAARYCLQHFSQQHLLVLAPLLSNPPLEGRTKGILEKLQRLQELGFSRVWLNGELETISSLCSSRLGQIQSLFLVVDRVVAEEKKFARISQGIESAYEFGGGVAAVQAWEQPLQYFSQKLGCVVCQDFRESSPSPRLFSFNSQLGACPRCQGIGSLDKKICPKCKGNRLCPKALSYKICGKTIIQTLEFTVEQAYEFFGNLPIQECFLPVARPILEEILERLRFLKDIGLSYLTLHRPTHTLSGGEAQRVQLATQLGAKLSGVLYVLDEPTVGLHPRDIRALHQNLQILKERRNTLVLVEHDPYLIQQADYVVDLGPAAGKYGGEILFSGPPSSLCQHPQSLTGRYLKKLQENSSKPPSKPRRKGSGQSIQLSGVCTHNLKNLHVQLPLGCFICVCGVSGSGKSSLILDTLLPALLEPNSPSPPARYARIQAPKFKHILVVDQKPIGKTPSSNPATYTKVFDHIRELYASLPLARQRGYSKRDFSFNSGKGRCPACNGDGMQKIHMHFLSDVWIPCPVCKGKRYQRCFLEVRYQNKSISDVLEMEISEAKSFFSSFPKISKMLAMLEEIGLGYLKLAQPATTLSTGETQRLKLAVELAKGRSLRNRLYILDEPTTGLHLDDIQKLLNLLHKIVDQGATVIGIEHNLEFVQNADYIVELGPEGGQRGGKILFSNYISYFWQANTPTAQEWRKYLFSESF